MTKTFLALLILAIINLLTMGCAQPQNGSTGIAGPTGAQGPTGLQGAEGPRGQDGQIATVVQLCPGVPHYGTVYVETALCINNQLYGVYSANGGFLTFLPPGAYTSNGIGSACNLTVLPNCQVQ